MNENIWIKFFPIETVSEFNCSENIWKKKKRHDLQKRWIKIIWLSFKPPSDLPCTIKLIRVSKRELDEDDNLRGAFKWVKDAIADQLIPGKRPGRADDDKRIKWEYAQEKGAQKGIKIQITS